MDIPKPKNLVRIANRKREKFRPRDPSDLEFDLNLDYVPDDFLQADIVVNTRRHLMFATARQLQLLQNAKRWYIDGTFRVVRAPFTQLLSIHAFIKDGDVAKQLPLVYVLMSGKRKNDYKAVLQVMLDTLDAARVREIMLDFEEAAWRALHEVIPEATLKGCVFHWGQAAKSRISVFSAHIKKTTTRTTTSRRYWHSLTFHLSAFQKPFSD